MAGKPIVVEFKPNTVLEALEELKLMAEQGILKSFVLAGFTNDPDNTVFCTMGLSVVQQQHLASVIQIETNDRHYQERVVTHILTESQLMDMGINPDDLDDDDE